MKVVRDKGFRSDATPICQLNSGDVVRREGSANTVYMVVNKMDGSRDFALVSVETGCLKQVMQDTPVIPIEAELHVGRDL
jgi:hypothetical protein